MKVQRCTKVSLLSMLVSSVEYWHEKKSMPLCQTVAENLTVVDMSDYL